MASSIVAKVTRDQYNEEGILKYFMNTDSKPIQDMEQNFI